MRKFIICFGVLFSVSFLKSQYNDGIEGFYFNPQPKIVHAKTDIDSTKLCDSIVGTFQAPDSTPTTILGTVSLVKFELMPYSNGVPISAPAYIIPTNQVVYNQATGWGSFRLPISQLSAYWPNLYAYDLVARGVFTWQIGPFVFRIYNNIVMSTEGIKKNFNNDIYPTLPFSYISDSQSFNKWDCDVKVKINYPSFPSHVNQGCNLPPCNLKTLIDNFNFHNGFVNYPTTLGGYTYVKDTSAYDCNSDIKWYEIRYKCDLDPCNRFNLSVRISTDCNIVLCSKMTCGSDAGTVLNPFLHNLIGSIRPDKTYVYNTRREDLAKNNLRKGEYLKNFSTLFSYPNWALNPTNDPNWIVSKQTTLYNHKGNEIESRNPLNIFSATRYGFNHSLPVAIASNSKYRNFISWGFDDEEYFENSCNRRNPILTEKYFLPVITNNTPQNIVKFDQSVNITNANSTNVESHTGSYSYLVIPKCFNLRNNSGFPTSSDVTVCNKSFLSKTIPLCGPSDPNYDNVTYDIKNNKHAQSVSNSYNAWFNLEKGKKYVLSYWVKNAIVSPNVNVGVTHEEGLGYIKIAKNCDTNYTKELVKKEQLIEGWKQMTEIFTVESSDSMIKIVFVPYKYGTYYDDIRIFPFDANMKSYVYQPRSLKLSAELDENNYATFYDYDEEGNLIRIRKETERGIMSIKEQRNVLKVSE